MRKNFVAHLSLDELSERIVPAANLKKLLAPDVGAIIRDADKPVLRPIKEAVKDALEGLAKALKHLKQHGGHHHHGHCGHHVPHGNACGWFKKHCGETPPPQVVPSLSGSVWVDRDDNGVRGASDEGLAGVVVTLEGQNDLGEVVFLSTTTGIDGSYSFTDLRPGTYSLSQGPVEDYIDGRDYPGSLGGESNGEDTIHGIQVTAGSTGTGYDFTENLDYVPPS